MASTPPKPKRRTKRPVCITLLLGGKHVHIYEASGDVPSCMFVSTDVFDAIILELANGKVTS